MELGFLGFLKIIKENIMEGLNFKGWWLEFFKVEKEEYVVVFCFVIICYVNI